MSKKGNRSAAKKVKPTNQMHIPRTALEYIARQASAGRPLNTGAKTFPISHNHLDPNHP